VGVPGRCRGQAADGTFAEALSAVPPFRVGLSVAVSYPLTGRPEVDLGSGDDPALVASRSASAGLNYDLPGICDSLKQMRQSCALEPDWHIVIAHDRAYRREDHERYATICR
jgi:hypothetical protein